MIAGTLPTPVEDLVADLIGRPIAVEELGGMSGARVMRVTGPAGSLVAKAGVGARELAVYRSLSEVFVGAGIRIPALLGSVDLAGDACLLLEAIPTPLPPTRWLGDVEVLTTLHRLHQLAPATLDLLPDRFRPAWTPEMDLAAMRWIGDEDEIADRLAALRREAAPLLEPHGVISGDPNPLNWGVSNAGELVLMDWERIGLGHPAIDLAVTVPGLPTVREIDRTIAVYRAISTEPMEGAVRIEPRHLLLAKLWTVIELLAESPPLSHANPVSGPIRRRQEIAEAVAGAIPDWIRQVL